MSYVVFSAPDNVPAQPGLGIRPAAASLYDWTEPGSAGVPPARTQTLFGAGETPALPGHARPHTPDDPGNGNGPPFCPPPFADGDWPGHANPPPFADLCPPNGTTVPEPSAIVLLTVGLVVMMLWLRVWRGKANRRWTRMNADEAGIRHGF